MLCMCVYTERYIFLLIREVLFPGEKKKVNEMNYNPQQCTCNWFQGGCNWHCFPPATHYKFLLPSASISASFCGLPGR